MRTAEEFHFACHISERRVDLRVRHLPLALHCQAAHLQQVKPFIATDGELHVECVAGEQPLKLAHQGGDPGQRRRACVESRFQANEGLQIVADTRGHAIGTSGAQRRN